MRAHFIISLLVLLPGIPLRAQLYFPVEKYYHGEIERRFLTDSSEHNFYFQHQSSKPILQSRTQADSIFADYQKQYYWLTQKLFKENFLIFKGDDFWCAVDPVVDLIAGHDFSIDSMHFKTWNTRGVRVQAKFYNKIGFTTTFYENQAFLLDYQRDYAASHGEYVPNAAVDWYFQKNAVVPGYGRTKFFKVSGYDFAFAEGQLSIEPNRFFNLQAGNGSQFIGNGYRSLLLSDFSFNYPFLKPEINLWNGRIQYSATYALLQNLYRLPYYTSPEATYERKIGTFHYLDVAVTKNMTIGVFEGAVWKRTDSLGTHAPDPAFLNPVILSGSLLKGPNAENYNSIIGFNVNFSFLKNALYGQLVIDQAKPVAWQAGIKTYDLFVPKLDAQLEYNHAEQNAYLSADKRYNYSHFNLPLAHPFTAGFDELIFRVSYQRGRWFAENRTIYSARYENDSLNIGTSILQPVSDIYLPSLTRTKVFYNEIEFGYRFNKRYNLQAVVGYLYRSSLVPDHTHYTNYFYAGIRTRLKNKNLDF